MAMRSQHRGWRDSCAPYKSLRGCFYAGPNRGLGADTKSRRYDLRCGSRPHYERLPFGPCRDIWKR